MSGKIILTKTCNNTVYGSDTDKNILLLGNNSNEIIIKALDFSHDFCFINGELFYTKDRKIMDSKSKIKLELDYPIKIKSKREKIYILDQEKSSVFEYDKNFNLLRSIGSLGLDKLEQKDEYYFHFPIDFDIFGDKIGVIDTGNRRTVIIGSEGKSVFPIIGKKLLFYDENTILVLYGETIYKIDLNKNSISEIKLEGIIDFSINPKTKELIISKE